MSTAALLIRQVLCFHVLPTLNSAAVDMGVHVKKKQLLSYGSYLCNTGQCLEYSACVLLTQLCPALFDPMDYNPPWNSPGHSTGVGCHFLLHGIFPTQGLNLGFLHCRQTLYCLSHQGNPEEGG